MSVATRPLKRTGASVNLRMNPLPSAVFATGPYKPSCRPDGWRHSGSGHGSMDGAGIGTGERGRDIQMRGVGGPREREAKGMVARGLAEHALRTIGRDAPGRSTSTGKWETRRMA